MILFVTGVSGSGKTTVAKELLKADLTPGFLHVVDIDGDGTPNAAHLDWLRWRAAELLYDHATTADRHLLTTVVCGISWPHAIIDSSAWPAAMDAGADVGFVMLDLPHQVVRQRLADRLASRPKRERKATLRYNRQLAATLRYQVTNQRAGQVLDVAGLTPAEVAGCIERRWQA